MYAKSSPGDVYHLLVPDEQPTICGLSVAPIVIDRPTTTSALHLTTNPPTGLEMCEDCAQIEKSQRKQETKFEPGKQRSRV